VTAAPAVSLEPMSAAHWEGVRRVYLEGIATGNATFETEAPSWEAWDRGHRGDCRIVALSASAEVLGFAALSRVSERCVYGGVAEVSVYVAAEARGSGLGRRLLERLIGASEEAGVWTLQAGIFPENAASIALHEKAGFRVVGVRRRLGRLAGRWRDVALLERRSERVGI
jgi:phosphinothricin acetyltransferase